MLLAPTEGAAAAGVATGFFPCPEMLGLAKRLVMMPGDAGTYLRAALSRKVWGCWRAPGCLVWGFHVTVYYKALLPGGRGK